MKWITVSDRTHVIRSFATAQEAEIYMFKRSALQPQLHVCRRWVIIASDRILSYRSIYGNLVEAVRENFPFFLDIAGVARGDKILKACLIWNGLAVKLAIETEDISTFLIIKGVTLDEIPCIEKAIQLL